MGILSFLRRTPSDPTADWLPGSITPPVDARDGSFGALHFDDGLNEAKFLGRPDAIHWVTRNYCQLLYAWRGFQLEFQDGRFVYLAFFIGPDGFVPPHPDLRFSQPCLLTGERFTSQSNREQLVTVLGPPRSEDRDSDETILFYISKSLTMEFELTPQNRLKRWSLYPTEKERGRQP